MAAISEAYLARQAFYVRDHYPDRKPCWVRENQELDRRSERRLLKEQAEILEKLKREVERARSEALRRTYNTR